MAWILVPFGGAAGTALRYGLALLGQRLWGDAWFPGGTFAANVLGSFLLGVVFVWGEGRTIAAVDARLVLGTGVMGGFTTYSSFNLELIKLLGESPLRASAYLLGTVATCLAAGLAGVALARLFR